MGPFLEHLLVQMSNHRKTQDLSLTAFGASLEKTTVLEHGIANELLTNTSHGNDAIDRHLEILRCTKHREEETIISVLFGPEYREHLQPLFGKDPMAAIAARYLDSLHHQHLSTEPDVHRLC